MSMREINRSPEEYVQLSPTERVKAWKWWFILLVVVGLVAAIWVVNRQVRRVQSLSSISFTFATPAFAQANADSSTAAETADDPTKAYAALGVTAVLLIVTLASFATILISKDKKKVAIASDTLKTCLGGIIGFATGYYGGK